MQQPGDRGLYRRLAAFYDWASRGLLAPFGGDTRFRRRVVDAWDIRPGQHVLELGCGTGLMVRSASIGWGTSRVDLLARA